MTDNADSIAIKVENVSKTFKLPHDKATSIKSSLINFIKRRHGYELQHALESINFEVKKGEFYGIVGRNGGGKSTLLKIISGIYTPTEGNVQVNGKLTPFIELGVGFNPELSGRENVYLNGALLGFNRKEMAGMYDEIVSFAELERFMDQKLKNYSSGMQVRLAFSIAIRAESDILVMDEVLAVGDAAFQKKCFEVFRELKKQGRTIILVTHDMGNVEKFCDRVLVINKGEQLAITTPAEAASTYAELNVDEKEMARKDRKSHGRTRLGGGEVSVKNVELTDGAGKPATVFEVGKQLNLDLWLERDKKHERFPLQIGLAIYNEDNIVVAGPNNTRSVQAVESNHLRITIPRLAFRPGEYTVTIALYDREGIDRFDYLEKWLHFSVVSDHLVAGLVDIEVAWEEKG